MRAGRHTCLHNMTSHPHILAQAVTEWARQDLDDATQPPVPTPAELRRLCRGHMLQVWNFLTEHIRSQPFAAAVRGNLKIHGRHRHLQQTAEESERKSLLERRDELRSRLVHVRSRLKKVGEEMRLLQTEVKNTDNEKEQLSTQLQLLREKVSVVKSLRGKVAKHTTEMKDYTANISTVTNRVNEVRSGAAVEAAAADVVFYSRLPSGVDGTVTEDEPPVVESRTQKLVRVECERIQQSNDVDDDDEMADKESDANVHLLDSEVYETSPSTLIGALTHVLRMYTGRIRYSRENGNLQEQISKLRYKYCRSNGGLLDMGSDQVLKNGYRLLEDLRNEHLVSFQRAEVCRNRASDLDREVAELNAKLHGDLDDEEDSANDPVAESVLLHNRTEAAHKTLAYLEGREGELTEVYKALELDVLDLERKRERILESDQRNQRKHERLLSVFEDVEKMQGELRTRQREIAKFVHRHVVQGMQRHLAGAFDGMIDMPVFESAHLDRCRFSHLECAAGVVYRKDIPQPVLSLDMYRRDVGYARICRSLDVSNTYGVTKILQVLAANRATCTQLGKAVQLQRNLIQLYSSLVTTTKSVQSDESIYAPLEALIAKLDAQTKEFAQQIQHQEEVQKSSWLKKINSTIGNCERAMESMESVQRAAVSWWEQPGQFCASWVVHPTYGTLRQVLGMYKQLCIQLRQGS